MTKNELWGDTDQKTFGFLKITRTSYPNDSHLFTLQPAKGEDQHERASVSAKPYELLLCASLWVAIQTS
jgi:hypothetical protein